MKNSTLWCGGMKEDVSIEEKRMGADRGGDGNKRERFRRDNAGTPDLGL